MDIRNFALWNWPKPNKGADTQDGDPLNVLRSDIKRAFEAFRQTFPTRVHARWDVSSGDVEVPRIDVMETKSQIIVFAEMPGVKESEIEISLDEDILGIEGKKRAVELSGQDAFFINERTFGTFQRIVPLPSRIDADKVEAQFSDGVVRVTAQKADVSKSAEEEAGADRPE